MKNINPQLEAFKNQIIEADKKYNELLKNGFDKMQVALVPLPPKFVFNSSAFESKQLLSRHVKSKKFQIDELESYYKTDSKEVSVYNKFYEKNVESFITDRNEFYKEYLQVCDEVIAFESIVNKIQTTKYFNDKKYIQLKRKYRDWVNKNLKSYLELLAISHYGSFAKTKYNDGSKDIISTSYLLYVEPLNDSIEFFDLFEPRLEQFDSYSPLKSFNECVIRFDYKMALKEIINDVDEYLRFENEILNKMDFNSLYEIFSKSLDFNFDENKEVVDGHISYKREVEVDKYNVTHNKITITIPFLGVSFAPINDALKLALKVKVKEYVEEYNSFEVIETPSFESQILTYSNELNEKYMEVTSKLPGGGNDFIFIKEYLTCLKKPKKYGSPADVINFVNECKAKAKINKRDELYQLMEKTIEQATKDISLRKEHKCVFEPIK